MAQSSDQGSQSGAVEIRLQAQAQAFQNLDQQYGFFEVGFGSTPEKLGESSCECESDDTRVFLQPNQTKRLGEVQFYRIEYEYFKDQLWAITAFTEKDEGKSWRPLFDYLVATFGHSINRPKAKQFTPLAKTWSSKRVRLNYYSRAGEYNLTRNPKLPPARGACLVVTSTEIATQLGKDQRCHTITRHKKQADTAWKACKLELEDQGWKIGCKVRMGADDTEVIVELSGTHRDLPDVDIQLPWPRGEKPVLQDAAVLNPAYAILEKRIALLHQKRR